MALDNLNNLSKRGVTHLTETFVMAWGQLGRYASNHTKRFLLTLYSVLRDRELNLVLLRLVEYLGYTNQIVSGVAFNEVSNKVDSLNLY